jgi:hypothetical protein
MWYDAQYCYGNFYNAVYYGTSSWPSYSYWIVPGSVRDIDRATT